ncbi:MAG: hypothetical protein JNM84_05510 [Planctomycetes bacterium]|nr:hypothetical protein [Planctomycetota bacterium]
MNDAADLRLPLVAAVLGCLWFGVLSLAIALAMGEAGEILRNLPLYLLLLLAFAPSSALSALLCRKLWRRDLDRPMRCFAGGAHAYLRGGFAGLLFLGVVALVFGASPAALGFPVLLVLVWPAALFAGALSSPVLALIVLVLLLGFAELETRLLARCQPLPSPRERARLRPGFRNER